MGILLIKNNPRGGSQVCQLSICILHFETCSFFSCKLEKGRDSEYSFVTKKMAAVDLEKHDV